MYLSVFGLRLTSEIHLLVAAPKVQSRDQFQLSRIVIAQYLAGIVKKM